MIQSEKQSLPPPPPPRKINCGYLNLNNYNKLLKGLHLDSYPANSFLFFFFKFAQVYLLKMFLLCKNERALWSVEKRSRWLRRPPCWKRGPDVGAETPRPGELRRQEAARRPGGGGREDRSWGPGRALAAPSGPAGALPSASTSRPRLSRGSFLRAQQEAWASCPSVCLPGVWPPPRAPHGGPHGRPFAGRRLPSAGPGSERLCSSRRTLSQGRPLGHVSRGRFSSPLWERTWGRRPRSSKTSFCLACEGTDKLVADLFMKQSS